MRGLIDYRALNRIRKSSHASMIRADKMFDRLGQAKYVFKLDLKIRFHRITQFLKTLKHGFEHKIRSFQIFAHANGPWQSAANASVSDELHLLRLQRRIYRHIPRDILIFSNPEEEYLSLFGANDST